MAGVFSNIKGAFGVVGRVLSAPTIPFRKPVTSAAVVGGGITAYTIYQKQLMGNPAEFVDLFGQNAQGLGNFAWDKAKGVYNWSKERIADAQGKEPTLADRDPREWSGPRDTNTELANRNEIAASPDTTTITEQGGGRLFQQQSLKENGTLINPEDAVFTPEDPFNELALDPLYTAYTPTDAFEYMDPALIANDADLAAEVLLSNADAAPDVGLIFAEEVTADGVSTIALAPIADTAFPGASLTAKYGYKAGMKVVELSPKLVKAMMDGGDPAAVQEVLTAAANDQGPALEGMDFMAA